MVLIKSEKHLLETESSSIINFYRNNPIIAANHLLRLDDVPLELAPIQQIFLTEWFNHKFSLLTAARGSGKSLKNGTNVLTGSGWIKIEDLKEEDIIKTPRGNSKIIGVYPQGKLDIFELEFIDGRKSFCSLDHLWKVKLIHDNGDIIETVETLQVIWSYLLLAQTLKNTVRIFIPSLDTTEVELISIKFFEQYECTCIRIEDPEGLFIIDDNIITHNTLVSAVYAALQTLLYPSATIGIFAPAFRQSKLIFKEFDNIYQNSPILQQSIDKPPTYGNDQCICTYKSIRQGIKPSEIRALPVGVDGGKIRGARFKRVILDEIVHLPETIFRSAIQPMMSTTVNPMKRVREVEMLRRANAKVIPVSDNGYIGITSGYYQFNYWWLEIVKFYDAIQKGSKLYNLRFIPHWELPEGFYDEEVVKDAEVNSPRHMFATEWLADWISDSEGAFPMSLLESVRDPKVKPKYAKDPNTDKGKEYIFGVDSARESDSTAIAIFELGYPSKLVFLEEIEDKPFPYQAKLLFDLIDRFKPIRIYMDEYGGGNVIRDHLEDPTSVGLSKTLKVIQVDASLKNTGKAILQLCNFNSAFIEDANNDAKTLLEQRAILFPDATNPIESTKKSVSGLKTVDLVQDMINQISSVVVTKTPTGRLHYDLPKKRGSIMSPNLNKKDLYTAFILGCKCIYDLQWKPKVEKVMLNKGVIKELDMSPDLTQDNFDGRIVGGSRGTMSLNDNKKTISGGGVIIRRDGRRK